MIIIGPIGLILAIVFCQLLWNAAKNGVLGRFLLLTVVAPVLILATLVYALINLSPNGFLTLLGLIIVVLVAMLISVNHANRR